MTTPIALPYSISVDSARAGSSMGEQLAQHHPQIGSVDFAVTIVL